MTQVRKAVVFDLYGTLVDVELDEVSARFWRSLSEDLRTLGIVTSADEIRVTYHGFVAALGAENRRGFLLDGVFTELLRKFGMEPSPARLQYFADAFRRNSIVLLEKKPFVDPLLSVLRSSDLKLALLSNTEALLTTYDLNALRLQNSFDVVVLSSNTGSKKPDRQIFLDVLAKLGLEAPRAVLVGNDPDADILGALEAGLDAVFVTRAASHDARFSEHAERVVQADFTFDSLVHALERLGCELQTRRA